MSQTDGMTYTYYPGCSLHSTAMEYNNSVESVFETLGVRLQEMHDWNCCTASSGHSLNRPLSLALPARNLALAQKTGYDVVMPCAACFNRHKATEYVLKEDPDKRAFIQEAVGFEYSGESSVRAVLDVVANDIGLDAVGGKVKKTLKGLKVVSYYGCLLVRPAEITQFENPEFPVLMDLLLAVLGAEVKKWSNTTDCCGGGLALTKPKIAANMVNRLAERAREAGADAIVTSCPLCQMNLEMRQEGVKTQIFYFTELMGLAFGCEEARSWWPKHLIDPTGLLHSVNLE